MTLKKINEHVHSFDFEFTVMPCVPFAARSTIVTDKDDGTFVISPGPFGPDEVQEIRNLHEKITIIAPNCVHYAFLKQALHSFPHAACFAPSTLGQKRKELAGLFKPLEDLKTQNTEILQIVGNSFVNEFVFFHKPSQTLVTTDFVFNMKSPHPGLRGLVLKMVGCHNGLAQSRLVKWTMKNKSKFLDSVRQMSKWNPRTVVMAHGDVIYDDKLWSDFLRRYLS